MEEDITPAEMEDPEMDIMDVYQILDRPGVQLWTHTFATSPIPLTIINNSLQILWGNDRFREIFAESENYEGLTLMEFFPRSFKREWILKMAQDIRTYKCGYSWNGRIEHKRKNQITLVSNLLILPIFRSPLEIKLPSAYACIFDNITEEYRQMLKITFASLLEASLLKDKDTGRHIQRVNLYSKALAETLQGIPSYNEVDIEFIENVGFLAAMHDVGKIGIPDDILNKQDKLNKWEMEVMKEHTINGAFILNTYPNIMAKEIALYHHERWDGNGYPYGLRENMIPLSARIVAIADVYDALRMKRSYKEPFPHETAKNILIDYRESYFEPFLIDRFLDLESQFIKIFDNLGD
ncbi:MAG: HD domain-containing protein [Spirochaetales bacterium]|nr:HD domain-containing protein [Spirochaetales bacterium]